MFEHLGQSEEEQKRIIDFEIFMGQRVSSPMELWLIQQGFFYKPASIRHHGSYEGALFDHSYCVAKCLVELTEKLEIKWKNRRSPYIVGMFHDLCKLYAYKKVGDEWKFNDDTLFPGHGEKSVIITEKFIELNEEEILCIRWHMGAFDEKENWNRYSKSCGLYPAVLFTHTADMMASQIKEV